jgi:prevent-host-death family protein
MNYINIHEAKTHFSKYVQQLEKSSQPIIICKNGTPVAQLIPFNQAPKRAFGVLKGKITISNDFDTLPQEFMQHFQ